MLFYFLIFLPDAYGITGISPAVALDRRWGRFTFPLLGVHQEETSTMVFGVEVGLGFP